MNYTHVQNVRYELYTRTDDHEVHARTDHLLTLFRTSNLSDVNPMFLGRSIGSVR